ncbi:MAG: hypothetical protein M3O35_12875 [Acidobacteriota bacterium]|nr:hypothetical protein [Acidobacteriota bacterium]
MSWLFLVFRPRAVRAAVFLLTVSAFAQPPLIFNRGIFNAASFMPAGIPAGAIARGSIFSVFGARLGPSQPFSANSFPLGNTLNGVALNVIQGSTTVSAIPLYVSASQINAIMPSNAPLGAASIQVVVNGSAGNLHPVQIASSDFGVFTAVGIGIGPGILQNFIAADNQPINSPTITATYGQAITLWGTGLGPVTGGDNVAPKAGNLPVQTEVFVGGVSAPLLYSGRTPCCAGVDQIVFTVPASAPSGCWVPVYVRTGGTTVSNVVTMAIQPSGGACTTDILPQITSAVVKGGTFGLAIVVRGTTRHDVGTLAPVDATADYHASFAFSAKPGPFPFNPAIAFPPSGTCTAYTLQGDILNGDPLPGQLPPVPPLDMGAALVLTGPRGTTTLNSTFLGLLDAKVGFLGGSISNNILPSSLILDPGSYTIAGTGGMDVGPFSTSFSIPQPLVWTNRNQLTLINRAQPLTLSWSGGDSGQVVVIVGYGEDLPTNSSAAFACIAPPGATSFTVPPAIMSNIPPGRPNPLQSNAVLYVGVMAGSSVQKINAKGLDQGLTESYYINGKTVVFQ